jgi:hypothetical protein
MLPPPCTGQPLASLRADAFVVVIRFSLVKPLEPGSCKYIGQSLPEPAQAGATPAPSSNHAPIIRTTAWR